MHKTILRLSHLFQKIVLCNHFKYLSRYINKINIVKLTDKHPKIKNSLLSLHFLKNYFKIIKEIREKKFSEFELDKKESI